MNTKVSSRLLLLTLLCTSASAGFFSKTKSLNLDFVGKVHNYSKFDLSKLEIKLSYSCGKATGFFQGNIPKGCGEGEIVIPVNSNGEYEVNDFEVKRWKNLKKDATRISVSLSHPDVNRKIRDIVVNDNSSAESISSELSEISFYHVANEEISSFSLKSGKDAKKFLEGKGKDTETSLIYKVDYQNGVASKFEISRNFDRYLNYTPPANVARSVSFALKGDQGPYLSGTLEIKVCNYSELTRHLAKKCFYENTLEREDLFRPISDIAIELNDDYLE